METRAEFVSGVSHELRAPLTAIGGYARVLLTGDAGPLSGMQREFIETISVNADRLNSLVSDILDVEKIDAGPKGATISFRHCGNSAYPVR